MLSTENYTNKHKARYVVFVGGLSCTWIAVFSSLTRAKRYMQDSRGYSTHDASGNLIAYKEAER